MTMPLNTHFAPNMRLIFSDEISPTFDQSPDIPPTVVKTFQIFQSSHHPSLLPILVISN